MSNNFSLIPRPICFTVVISETPYLKAAKYEIQKPSTCFVASFGSMFRLLSPCVINLSSSKFFGCGLKKAAVKSRVQLYFEQQILAFFMVFHQTRIAACLEFSTTKSTSERAAFSQPATNVFCCATTSSREV